MKKISLLICCICLLATSVGIMSATALVDSGSIITKPDSITVTKDYAIPDGVGDISDKRHGLLLSTAKSDTFAISSEMSGEFELDFKVFSNITGKNDFKSLTFEFTDTLSNESFKVEYEMDHREDFEVKGLGKAFATFPNGQNKFGAYEGDKLLDHQWGGVHTSSFNNKFSEKRTENAGINKIKFDPLTKEVYIYAFSNYELLIDLDSPKDVEKAKATAVEGFDKYKVSVKIDRLSESVSATSPARMVLYSLNKQTLAGQTLVNSAGANLAMNFSFMSIEGYDYKLPEPLMYDVIDGYTPFNGTITAKTKGGSVVAVENGVIKSPTMGKYIVTLSGARDSGGLVTADKSFEFTTSLNHPGHEIIFNEKLKPFSIGAGSEVFLPGCEASSKINYYGDHKTTVNIEVLKDNVKIDTLKNITSGVMYTATNAGRYSFDYISKDVIGHIVKKSLAVEVVADAPIINVANIEGTFPLNSEFVVPSITATLNGKAISVDKKLISPFGEITTRLDKVGDYKYIVSYAHNSVIYAVERGFKVKRDSSQMFVNKRASVITPNQNSPSYAMPYNGIKVSASRSNSTIQYVNPIDISKLTKETSLVQILPLTSEKDFADFGMLTVTLTDVNNPKSSISVKISRSYDRGYYWLSLVRAGVNNTNYAGWAWGQLKVGEGSGTNMTTSFLGSSLNPEAKAIAGDIYFDYAEKTFYCGYFDDKLNILDLDSAKDVGAGNEWQGFSSNMAYLTISANSLENRTAEYMVLSVAGQPLSGTYLDSAKPVTINVDKKGNEQTPKGKVNVKYPIFDVEVFDNINSGLYYDTAVYYNYKKSNQQIIEITEDNCFVPTVNGVYTIVYTCGNVKNEVPVTVETLEDISFTLLEQYPTSMFVGSELALPYGIAEGGSGNITSSYVVTLNGEILPLNGNAFTPLAIGNIKVKLTLTDYLGQSVTKEYAITSAFSPKPILSHEISMPKAILADKDYVFSSVDAKYYSTENASGVVALYDIFVTKDNETTMLTSRQYKPSLSDVGKDIVVKYKIYSANKANFLEKSYTVKIIKPQYKSDYFVKEQGITSIATESGAVFTITQNGVQMQFVNTLSSALEFMFAVPSSSLTSIDFFLTDSINASIKVKLSVVKVGSRNNLYINDKKGGLMAGVFGGDAFTLKVHGNEVFNAKDNLCGAITSTIYGKQFDGFTSNKVYMDVAFNGVDGEAKFNVLSLNSQLFDEKEKDFLKPTIFIDGEIKRTANFNEVVVLPSAFAMDVLDPYTELTLTVKAPKGVVIFDKVDISQALSFKADKYGQYNITYTAVDSRKNPSHIRMAITVADNIPPTIEVKGEMPKEGRINTEIVLPQFIVSDNNDTGLVAYIHYLDPCGKMVRIKDNKFTPKVMGDYTISVFAKDNSYSNVRLEYTIRIGK